MVKAILKKLFNPSQRQWMRKRLTDLKTIGNGHNLTRLAELYGTDKTGGHFYTLHYQDHFRKFNSPFAQIWR